MSSLKAKKSSRTNAPPPVSAVPAEVVIGEVVGISADLSPIVVFKDSPTGGPLRALATASYDETHIGRSVALMFVGGDRAKPLALGVVPVPDAEERQPSPDPEERLTLSAKQEIVLQCGKASIILTKAGKVLVRGSYISSWSSGAHRIKGGSVNIN